jgi:hypothetical protein
MEARTLRVRGVPWFLITHAMCGNKVRPGMVDRTSLLKTTSTVIKFVGIYQDPRSVTPSATFPSPNARSNLYTARTRRFGLLVTVSAAKPAHTSPIQIARHAPATPSFPSALLSSPPIVKLTLRQLLNATTIQAVEHHRVIIFNDIVPKLAQESISRKHICSYVLRTFGCFEWKRWQQPIDSARPFMIYDFWSLAKAMS